jgi:hypothetical protein
MIKELGFDKVFSRNMKNNILHGFKAIKFYLKNNLNYTFKL